MAITVTPNLTTISLCEDATGWDDGTATSDVVIQGSNSLGDQLKAVLGPICKYTFGSAQDMTGKHIYIWMNCAGTVDTKANGGYRIYVETDGSNYGTWYVGGKDTHPAGGWICFIIDPASTPTDGLGTINVASITKVGVQFKTLTSVVGQAMNVFWDACRYGTGLTITSGVSDQIGVEDIFAEDDNISNKYGVVTKSSGAYIVQGLLTFGGTDAENIDFVDKNQIILFPTNEFASSSFYGIKVQCGTGTTNFILGEKSGTAGIKGCILKSVGTTIRFSFDVSDPDNDKVQIYGSTFINAGTITLPPNASNREVLNCSFDNCLEILADTCIVTYCKFISSPSSAIRINSVSYGITNCDFISCERGIHITTASALSYDALKFSACTYDGYATGGDVTVSYNAACSSSNGWNYDPVGDTITYQTSVTLTVRHVKTGSEPAEYVRCSIHKKLDMSELMNKDATVEDEQNTGYYKASESCTQTGIVVIIRAREKGYYPFEVEMTIPSGGLDVTAVWIEDPNYVP